MAPCCFPNRIQICKIVLGLSLAHLNGPVFVSFLTLPPLCLHYLILILGACLAFPTLGLDKSKSCLPITLGRELGAQKVDLELEDNSAEKMLVFQIQRSKFNLWLLNLKKMGWRIDLVIKNIFCSCRESGFNSRHLHGDPHTCLEF